MGRTIDDIISMIDIEIDKYASSEAGSIGKARLVRLESLRNFISIHGLPKNMKERFELSLAPYCFQEANYDDLDPTSKDGDLGHLKGIYDIDLAVQVEGLSRETISDSAFSKYLNIQSRAIAWRLKRARFWDRLLLFVLRARK